MKSGGEVGLGLSLKLVVPIISVATWNPETAVLPLICQKLIGETASLLCAALGEAIS